MFATIKGAVLAVTSQILKIYNKEGIWSLRCHFGTS